MNKLLSAYWRPVYQFIRASQKSSVEDAKDLAQGFFCHILDGDMVARYQPDKGRFRHFLKGSLRNFLAETYRTGQRQKRGGDRVVVSLDAEGIGAANLVSDGRQLTPEEIFDRQWALDVVDQCWSRLRRDLVAEGKPDHVRVYEAYDLSPAGDSRPTYEGLALSLGLALHDVRNYLEAVRARLHALIVLAVTDYVTTREEASEEMRDLFSRRKSS